MSSHSPQTIKCPKCAAEKKIEIWNSINVTLDPSLREKLFNGEINIFKCDRCQDEALIYTSLLYNNMDLQFSVQFYPPQSLDDPEFIKLFEVDNPPLLKGLPKSMGYLAKPHIVFDMSDMISCIIFHEKIRKK